MRYNLIRWFRYGFQPAQPPNCNGVLPASRWNFCLRPAKNEKLKNCRPENHILSWKKLFWACKIADFWNLQDGFQDWPKIITPESIFSACKNNKFKNLQVCIPDKGLFSTCKNGKNIKLQAENRYDAQRQAWRGAEGSHRTERSEGGGRANSEPRNACRKKNLRPKIILNLH